MFRLLLVLAVLSFVPTVRAEVTADVTVDQALALARAAAIAQHADLAQPDTTVKQAFSDQVIALDISDPYRLNGTVYWRNYTHYETTKHAVAQYTGLGDDVHAAAAAQPMASVVPDDLRPKVLEFLAYWHTQQSLDPELRVGAHATKAWGFHFHRGDLFGSSAFIGVDADGQVFHLNVQGPLTPWEASRSGIFALLYQALE